MDIAKSRNFLLSEVKLKKYKSPKTKLLKENIQEKLSILKRVCNEMGVDFNEFYEDGEIMTIEGSYPLEELSNDNIEFEKEIREIIQDSNNEAENIYESDELNEMAKIQGDLKTAIEKVITDNPEVNGLPLKKLIRADQSVLDALDGEDLYDNQLNKFIASSKGEREVGSRGRKPGGSTDAQQDVKVDIPSHSHLPQNVGPELDYEDDVNTPEVEDDEEIIDTWNTPEEDDDSEKEPTAKDIKAIKIPDSGSGDVDNANAYKNIIVKKVNKIEALPPNERAKSVDMSALKQFIAKPNVIKALTLPTIRSLVSSIIG